MHERIADALLVYTGHEISAAVSLGEKEEILGVNLFDTIWQAERMRVDPLAAQCHLISNHPCGEEKPYQEDFDNARRLSQMSGRDVRLFIVSEYFSCREIAL